MVSLSRRHVLIGIERVHSGSKCTLIRSGMIGCCPMGWIQLENIRVWSQSTVMVIYSLLVSSVALNHHHTQMALADTQQVHAPVLLDGWGAMCA